jgi:hypothetical protein
MQEKTEYKSLRSGLHNFVAYLLKARNAEPQKQPLLPNGSEHIPAAAKTHATTELLLETECFLCGPRRDVISKGPSQLRVQLSSAWEAVKIGPGRVKLKNLHC